MRENIIKILTILILLQSIAFAGEGARTPKQIVWPFEGLFGHVDRQAAQRGLQVYLEVCAACHSMEHLYYRNLKAIGFSDAEIKEIAKQHNVTDGPNDDGEMFERPALPQDLFVKPYANEQAARAANNGAHPPDLSLIIKSRHDGANYVHALLNGYEDPPKDFHMMEGLNYNPYFEGSQIGMSAPLSDGRVIYSDGTEATVEQMSKDVVVFLQWAAEPEMEHRKSMGLKVFMFLILFTIFFYIVKKKVWSVVNLS